MEAINITAFTKDTSQIDALKACMKALKLNLRLPKNPIIRSF